ncbi:MAG: sulfite exporter TauE/SafE family protein [Gemmataceae bacterium]
MGAWHLLIAFAWCTLAGFLMSMGAGGGGILVGIGQISILGIVDPNMVKVVNQLLELVSRLVSVPMYHRQKRLVWSLAISYGVGAPIGAIVGAWFSKTYLSNMAVYRPAFGVLMIIVAGRVLYEGFARSALAHSGRRRAHEVSRRVLQQLRMANRTPDELVAARTVSASWTRVSVRFGGEIFDFNPISAAAGGFCIALVASTLGVGGGFLVTPFMASVLMFPMYLVIGTGLVALMPPLAVSVVSYLALNVRVDLPLLAVEVPAIVLGSLMGPVVNRYLNERLLKTLVALILLSIGLYYAVPY